MRGLLITFEGCDGSGKSTQIAIVKRELDSRGISALVTREPGGTPLGEAIRSFLLDPAGLERCAMAEVLLYSAARAELVEQVIRPEIEKGTVVLTERYYDSTTVYQGIAGGISVGDIEAINRITTGGLAPDLTIVFDIGDEEIFRERLGSRERDKIESRSDSYHHRVREGYRAIASMYPERVCVVDGSLPLGDVSALVLGLVLGFLEKRQRGDCS